MGYGVALQAMNTYVCDKCANTWQAYRADTCPACKTRALWEFPPGAEDSAAHHVTLIRERLAPAPVER